MGSARECVSWPPTRVPCAAMTFWVGYFYQLIEMRLGWAAVAFGSVSVSTPSSS